MTDSPEKQTGQLVEAARRLWRGSFHGMLSTHSATHPGYPFGSVLPFCLDRDGLPLLLLSHLAQHSKNLQQNPACALLLSEDGDGDVQQLARLSLVADCEPLNAPDQTEVERYFRYFPHARPYFEQLNFRFFRLRPRHFHLNAGFAAARWLGPDRVLRPREFDPDTEMRLCEKAPQAQNLITSFATDESQPVSLAGLDAEGMDLCNGQRLMRLPFPSPICGADDLDAAIRGIESRKCP